MKSIFLSILLTVFIIGCGSFNNSFNTYPSIANESTVAKINTTEKITIKEAQIVVKEGDKKPNLCPPYQMPLMPKTPELPFNNLDMNKMTIADIEQIERNHIDELRAFITKYKTDLRKSHLDYILACSSFQL